MSDFKVTLKMWNEFVLKHNKLVDRVKELEHDSSMPTIKREE